MKPPQLSTESFTYSISNSYPSVSSFTCSSMNNNSDSYIVYLYIYIFI